MHLMHQCNSILFFQTFEIRIFFIKKNYIVKKKERKEKRKSAESQMLHYFIHL